MRFSHILAVAVVLLATTAQGQSQTAPQAPADTAINEGVAPASVAPREKVRQAKQIVQRGEQLSRRIGTMLEEARKDGDVIRSTCLDDKLTQTNVNTRNAASRTAALQSAIQTGDGDLQNHEYTVLSVLGRKLTTLAQEAGQCVGQDLYETGQTRVVTTIDPRTPSERADVPVVPPVPGFVTVPPPSSPAN